MGSRFRRGLRLLADMQDVVAEREREREGYVESEREEIGAKGK